ncbi:zinc finger protein, partial [Striga asiatica]
DACSEISGLKEVKIETTLDSTEAEPLEAVRSNYTEQLKPKRSGSDDDDDGSGPPDKHWICLHCKKKAEKTNLPASTWQFKYSRNLSYHYNTKHNEIVKKGHFCKECWNSFRTHKQLLNHECQGRVPGPR